MSVFNIKQVLLLYVESIKRRTEKCTLALGPVRADQLEQTFFGGGGLKGQALKRSIQTEGEQRCCSNVQYEKNTVWTLKHVNIFLLTPEHEHTLGPLIQNIICYNADVTSHFTKYISKELPSTSTASSNCGISHRWQTHPLAPLWQVQPAGRMRKPASSVLNNMRWEKRGNVHREALRGNRIFNLFSKSTCVPLTHAEINY